VALFCQSISLRDTAILRFHSCPIRKHSLRRVICEKSRRAISRKAKCTVRHRVYFLTGRSGPTTIDYLPVLRKDPLLNQTAVVETTVVRRRFAPFVLYLIAFHLFWMWGYVFGIYPWMRTLGESTVRYAATNLTLRFLIWIVPVFLYLRYVDHVNPIDYLKLRAHWKRGVIIGIVLSILNFFGTMTRFGVPHVNTASLTWNSIIGTSILIGFFEEIPYRGFMLQKFEERYGFWIANLLSSILFLIVHFPGWISLHLFKVESVISVFIFGAVMAIILKYGKSLWGPIIAHSLNDCIAFVIFRI
jgi:uncharacterized protein